MTKSTKALLLSAFVYPGVGQLLLKRYYLGTGFIVVTTIGLYFILANTFKIANQIIERVQSGEQAPDFSTLLSLISQHDSNQLNNAFTVMVIAWLASLIHIYLIGKITSKYP